MEFVLIQSISSPSTNNFSFFLTVKIAHATKFCTKQNQNAIVSFRFFFHLWFCFGTKQKKMSWVNNFIASNKQLSIHAEMTWGANSLWDVHCALCSDYNKSSNYFRYKSNCDVKICEWSHLPASYLISFQPVNIHNSQTAIFSINILHLCRNNKYKWNLGFWNFVHVSAALFQKIPNLLLVSAGWMCYPKYPSR